VESLFPIRDQTHIPCTGRRILNYWTTREVPARVFLDEINIWPKAWGPPGPIKLTLKISHHICIHFCGICIVVGNTYHWIRQHSALVITTGFPGWLYQFTLILAVCLEFYLLYILTSTWCDQSFLFYLHVGCGEASVTCWSWLLWLMRVSCTYLFPILQSVMSHS